MDAVISRDFRFIALKTRENYDNFDGGIEILDTIKGSVYKIDPPTFENAPEISLISLKWESRYLKAIYNAIYDIRQNSLLYDYQF